MATAVQVLGAVLILGAFALVQTDRWTVHAYPYLVLNLTGAGILATSALIEAQWGFVLLNTVWSLVAIAGLVQRGRRPDR